MFAALKLRIDLWPLLFIIRRILKLLLRIVIWFVAVSVGLVLLFKWYKVPVTPLMLIRSSDQWSAGEKIKMEHDWVALKDISQHLQAAVICSEDQNFLSHNGFDWGAIEDAVEKNKLGKKLRGGSTISQQTAKNVFLWPGRSYVRKGFEAYFTMLIELFWSKERIMEVYLNSIEMGKGVYGAEAAARHWFNKSAENLTMYEAAALSSILPNPRRYSANPPGPYIVRRQKWVLQQMKFRGEGIDYGNNNKSRKKDEAQNNKKK